MDMFTTILIIVGILILIGVLIISGFFIIAIGTSAAIGAQKQYSASAWDYWKQNCHHKWDELSEQEKEQMIQAYLAIQSDCGGVGSEEEIRDWLPTQLPYKCDGSCLLFQHNNKN